MLVPKLFTCLKDYTKEQFVKDIIAGIIVAIIALPLSIALAIASGVSPEKGMYTAVVGGFIIALLGGSRVQIGGPTGAFVIIVYGIVEKYGLEGLTVATIIAGIFLIIMGVFRFGAMIKYIPYPITTGFTSGIAITIFSTQIKDFFGLSIDKVPSEFISKWAIYFESIKSTNLTTLFIGVLSLLIIMFWPKINKKVPGTLIAVVASTVIVMVFGMNIETIGSRFGNISGSFPMPTIPKVNINMIRELIIPGITIAILGGVESLLSAVVADGMIGGNHRSNMELVGQGVANIFSGIFGGIPATGAIARTAANVKNGGRTPIAGIVHAISLLVIMLVFMPYVKLIPMASLAAILIVVSYNMGEWEAFKKIVKAPKSDAVVFLSTFLLTIFLDLVVAIGIGVVLSSFLFMRRMAEVTNVTYDLDARENDECAKILENKSILEQISFYEISGPFFFGAAEKFVNVIREIGISSKVLIIKMGNVPAMDATAFHAVEILYDICKKNKTKLIISELQEQPVQMLNKYGFIEMVGEKNVCKDIKEAVQRAHELLE
ncbi:sulfate permease [Clostridium aestuarii]|uniref:Sulfate permease n=1 Tax=Clostridium aestuarii TaxID=338193 RepID=A0ABT4D5Z9_9CLOT|nr:sulfate permease [Clostridium aestuarii]